MPVESATYISQLDVTKPAGSDSKAEGDDQLRLLKSTVKATFPNFTAAPLNATQAQLDKLVTSVAVNASAPTNAVQVDASGRIVVAGSAATGRVTLTSSYVGVNPSATDGNVISFRNKTSGTTAVPISGGIFADNYRDVRDPAYAAGVWFERSQAAGGASSAGSIVFGATASPESTVLPTERGRFDPEGSFLVGTTSNTGAYRARIARSGGNVLGLETDSTASITQIGFFNPNGAVGSVITTGNTTSYNTSSDHRLKNNQRPLAGSGAFIDALKPKVWEWVKDGSRGVGFIAHEFQEVSPSSVSGEKDAVDADGNPIYQSMQSSSPEVMANIVAELQDLRRRVAALEAA